MISAFGIEHGEVSKAVTRPDRLRRLAAADRIMSSAKPQRAAYAYPSVRRDMAELGQSLRKMPSGTRRLFMPSRHRYKDHLKHIDSYTRRAQTKKLAQENPTKYTARQNQEIYRKARLVRLKELGKNPPRQPTRFPKRTY